MNPNFRNLFMKKLTRERVVPTISASVSLTDLGNRNFGLSIFAEACQQEENTNQSLLAGIQATSRMGPTEHWGSWASFSIEGANHGTRLLSATIFVWVLKMEQTSLRVRHPFDVICSLIRSDFR
jgi:hypothetical protein